VSPLTQGLRYRAACDEVFTLKIADDLTGSPTDSKLHVCRYEVIGTVPINGTILLSSTRTLTGRRCAKIAFRNLHYDSSAFRPDCAHRLEIIAFSPSINW